LYAFADSEFFIKGGHYYRDIKGGGSAGSCFHGLSLRDFFVIR